MSRRRLVGLPVESAASGLDIGALAPMVDMMTLLLVFLLRTYSSEPSPAPPEGVFELPNTASQDPRPNSLVLLVSTDAVYIDGNRVIATAYLPEEPMVKEIYDRLLATKNSKRVEVHVDRRVEYGVVRKVLYTARASGVGEVALVGSVEAGF
jgi:biopolymer transport protein ExbD